MPTFQEKLNEQIAYEFAASQQYIAIAVHYDAETLPQLAAHFYRQSVEERNHAMIMVQYLLDATSVVTIPAVAAPQTSFPDDVAPVALALDQEKRVTAQISAARRDGERERRSRRRAVHALVPAGAARGSLLHVGAAPGRRAARDNVMLVEDYLARESGGANPLEAGAPPAAGGAL